MVVTTRQSTEDDFMIFDFRSFSMIFGDRSYVPLCRDMYVGKSKYQ